MIKSTKRGPSPPPRSPQRSPPPRSSTLNYRPSPKNNLSSLPYLIDPKPSIEFVQKAIDKTSELVADGDNDDDDEDGPWREVENEWVRDGVCYEMVTVNELESETMNSKENVRPKSEFRKDSFESRLEKARAELEQIQTFLQEIDSDDHSKFSAQDHYHHHHARRSSDVSKLDSRRPSTVSFESQDNFTRLKNTLEALDSNRPRSCSANSISRTPANIAHSRNSSTHSNDGSFKKKHIRKTTFGEIYSIEKPELIKDQQEVCAYSEQNHFSTSSIASSGLKSLKRSSSKIFNKITTPPLEWVKAQEIILEPKSKVLDENRRSKHRRSVLFRCSSMVSIPNRRSSTNSGPKPAIVTPRPVSDPIIDSTRDRRLSEEIFESLKLRPLTIDTFRMSFDTDLFDGFGSDDDFYPCEDDKVTFHHVERKELYTFSPPDHLQPASSPTTPTTPKASTYPKALTIPQAVENLGSTPVPISPIEKSILDSMWSATSLILDGGIQPIPVIIRKHEPIEMDYSFVSPTSFDRFNTFESRSESCGSSQIYSGTSSERGASTFSKGESKKLEKEAKRRDKEERKERRLKAVANRKARAKLGGPEAMLYLA